MASEGEEVLRGLTLKVYRYALKHEEPIGVREVQRGLDLSSPSLAVYHLNKLEEAGFLKKEAGGYILDRVVLYTFVRLRKTLIPRYFFYTVFFSSALVAELFYFRPESLTSGYFFSTIVTLAAALFSSYETIKTWLKGGL